MIASRRKFIEDVGFALGSQFLSRILPAVMMVLIARRFGQSVYVDIALFNYSILAMSSLVALGLPNLAAKLASEVMTNTSRLNELATSLGFVFLLAIVLGLALFDRRVANWFRADHISVVLVYFCALSATIFSWSTNVLTGMYKQSATFWASVAGACALTVAFTIAWLLDNPKLIYVGITSGFAIPAVAQLCAIVLNLKQTKQSWLPTTISIRNVLADSFWFSLMSAIGPTTPFLLSSFLLKTDASGLSVALFSIGFQLMSISSLVPTRIAIVLFPYQIRQGNDGQIARKLSSIVLTILGWSCGMALVCAIFSSKILNVWHASSDHSNLLSFTFVIYGGLAVSANIFGNQLIASGAIKQVVIYTLLGQLFTLLSGWYLAQFGGEFMGIALLLGQTIVLASAFVSLQFGRAGSMTN